MIIILFRCAGISSGTLNGQGMSLEIWFQGCQINCAHCQNPNLQPLDGGFDYETDLVLDHLNKFNNFYNSICFLGGEPTLQPKPLYTLLTNITLPKILYTGLLFEDLPEGIKSNVDIVVDGPYIEEQATGSFPASANQRIFEKCILTNRDFRK